VKRKKALALFYAAMVSSSFAYAQEATLKVKVEDQTGLEKELPIEIKKNVPATETTVKKEEIQTRAGAGSVNIFKAVELTPSVNVQTDDAYGLSGGSIRIRGFDNTQIGVTIDDMPLNDSGNFALYPHEYADVENLETVTITRGSVNKRSPFYTEIGGAIKVRTAPPKSKFTNTLGLKFGSYNFKRAFYRLDTGYLFGNKSLPKIFFSYSHTEADKWKGPGGAPQYRDHYTLGIAQTIGILDYEFYYDRNVQLNYLYRPFTYAETKDGNIFRSRDYTNKLIPGNTANNVLYYEFYQNPYTNQQYRAIFNLNFTDKVSLNFKPYMWIGRGSGTSADIKSLPSGTKALFFTESFNYTDRPGFTTELKVDLPYNSKFFLGYWYEYADLKQWKPSRSVTVNSDGTYTLNNSTSPAYNSIQRTKTTTNTPYVSLESKELLGKLDLNLGFRFASIKRKFDNYNTTRLPYYPEDGVYDDPRLTKDANKSYEKTYKKTLPNIGLGFSVLDNLYLYASFAKNFRVPMNYSPAQPQDDKGKPTGSAQFVADQLKPEESDSYDLGARLTYDKFYIAPTAYIVRYKNRLIPTTDPNNPHILYIRNAGKVDAKGFELEVGANPMPKTNIYASFSYNEAKFKDDVFYDGNTKYNIKDNSVPDTPRYMVKLGSRFDVHDFKVSPSVQFIGSRYGDFTNKEKVDNYTIVNLSATRKIYKYFDLYMDVVNLTNQKYVGRINPGTTSGTYYAGAPFTISFGINGRF
jgi:iron complex outermembrane receptor protein